MNPNVRRLHSLIELMWRGLRPRHTVLGKVKPRRISVAWTAQGQNSMMGRTKLVFHPLRSLAQHRAILWLTVQRH